ncbi:SDR family oxidoreductase [Actinocorallia longicatena]|uniref:NAD(P)H-binding protein n=1 Tax=Actinocorallia longicatena TaxID=111803 RepID=A0ABP6QL66_9ACTN
MALILVTGGTGTLGTHVTPLLRAAGHDVRVLTRTPREGAGYVTGDLVRNEGLAEAVAGAEIVLHLAGGPKADDVAARHLVAAARDAGVAHLVHISVIGADRVPLAWLRTKLDAERAIEDSGIPWTILRAAQFHDLLFKVVAKMAKLPVLPVPGGLRFQPVDAREVAARLVELTLGTPQGHVPDLAGPKLYTLPELARPYLEARAKRRPRLPVRIPGKAGRAYREGANLTLKGATLGERTWEQYLTDHAA